VAAKATDDGARVRVETPLGPVVGTVSDGVAIFLGLPFAAPPVGQYRFAPPRDAVPWTEPLEALRPGPMAMQVPEAVVEESVAGDKASPGYSEDCLFLNVWAPAGGAGGLPVYVFIHGGGFGLGSGSQAAFDGQALAREGIVVVTINYRLGALGFLALRETLRRHGTTGNWGLLDQIKALEWVRDNIAAFGGDPGKVTIGGESAGSFSVSALIVSPLAKGLFRGAIMESGTVLALGQLSPFVRGDMDLSLGLGAILAAVFGAGDDEAGLARLQEADAGLLARLTPFLRDFRNPSQFGLVPVRDGLVIPKDPQGSLALGQGAKVRLLLGFNADEGSIFMPDDGGAPQSYLDALAIVMGPGASGAFWRRFPVDGEHGLVARAREGLAMALISAGAKRFADLHSRHAGTFLYRFGYQTAETRKLGLGACHSLELPFVFGVSGPEVTMGPREERLGREMRARWVNFVKTGDPNRGDGDPPLVEWPLYDPANPRAILFGETVTAGPLPGAEDLDFMARELYGPLPAAE
jgi:para-nitrobenzyl esterase